VALDPRAGEGHWVLEQGRCSAYIDREFHAKEVKMVMGGQSSALLGLGLF
jgi:uncharacterized membrane protein